jgi:hypothetical protein
MKFDEAINYIAENLTPVASEMAKPKNPFIVQRAAELEKQGLSPATAYAYARKEFLNQKTGSGSSTSAVPAAPAAADVEIEPTSADPAGVSFRELPDTLATKAKVAEIFAADPQVSDEDVVSRIAADAESGEILNTDADLIKQELSTLRSNTAGDEVAEPSAAELKKAELSAKYDRMRQALYRARGLKAKPGRKSTSKDEPEAGEEEETGYSDRAVNMRDEPLDPNEL